jgi:hypothetical protein
MDKFETTMASLARMSQSEIMKTITSLKSKCICPDCPTYTDCAKKAQESFFCWIGGSFVCISKENDCLCPSCPVTSEVGLVHNFFCTRGSGKTQRWDAEHKIKGN